MMKNLFRRKATAGFTMIELLVTIAIIGALMAIAAPGWLAFINARRANAARDQVLQSLRQTQAEASRTRLAQTVTFAPAVSPPTITALGVTQRLGNGEIPPGSISLRVVDAAGTVLNPPSIRYDPSGAIDARLNVPVTITVAVPPNSGTRRCVIVQTLLGATRTASAGEPGCP